MRLSLSHPPESRRLPVAGCVCWIISGLDLGEPLHAGGMDFGYAVFERKRPKFPSGGCLKGALQVSTYF